MSFVKSLIDSYQRTGRQLNLPFASDAEIIKTQSGYACVTIDTVSEEIEMGLIQSLEALGWLTVTASVSDLAAIGVETQNVHVAIGWADDKSELEKLKIVSGIKASLQKYLIPFFDISFFESKKLITSCTAFAETAQSPKVQRIGMQPGDLVFITGPIGWGNAVAFANLTLGEKAKNFDLNYRPLARIEDAEFIAKWATSAIDTSDGLLFSLDLLQQLNGNGFQVSYSEHLYHPVAIEVARLTQVNPFLFMAAQNGEFEILFTVASKNERLFTQAAKESGKNFIKIGKVTENNTLCFEVSEKLQTLDLTSIRNLLQEGVDPKNYVLAMLKFASNNRIH